MTDRLKQIGEMAHGTVRQEDVCWLIDEVERLRPVTTARRETSTLRRRGQRGKPGHEAYRVEKLYNRREPVVGSDVTPETVDRLIRHAGRPHQGPLDRRGPGLVGTRPSGQRVDRPCEDLVQTG